MEKIPFEKHFDLPTVEDLLGILLEEVQDRFLSIIYLGVSRVLLGFVRVVRPIDVVLGIVH